MFGAARGSAAVGEVEGLATEVVAPSLLGRHRDQTSYWYVRGSMRFGKKVELLGNLQSGRGGAGSDPETSRAHNIWAWRLWVRGWNQPQNVTLGPEGAESAAGLIGKRGTLAWRRWGGAEVASN